MHICRMVKDNIIIEFLKAQLFQRIYLISRNYEILSMYEIFKDIKYWPFFFGIECPIAFEINWKFTLLPYYQSLFSWYRLMSKIDPHVPFFFHSIDSWEQTILGTGTCYPILPSRFICTIECSSLYSRGQSEIVRDFCMHPIQITYLLLETPRLTPPSVKADSFGSNCRFSEHVFYRYVMLLMISRRAQRTNAKAKGYSATGVSYISFQCTPL